MLLKRVKVLMLAVLSIVALQVLPVGHVEAAGSYTCDGSPGVYIYQDDNYSGACYRVDVGNYSDLTSLGIPNDSASSIKIVNGFFTYYEATVYDNSNFQGAKSIYRFPSEQLGQDTIGNDRLSSLKVRIIGSSEYDGVYLYEHAFYHGDWVKVTANTPDLVSLSFNDKVSSLRLINVGNIKVRLFSDANYGGISYETGGSSILSQAWPNNFNDIASSVLFVNY